MIHRDASFIPEDSIFGKRTLAYRLNHFYDSTNQVFISCEDFTVKYFIKKGCSERLNGREKDTCLFPSLHSKILYNTINPETNDVFEIYYLDANWGKVKIKKGSREENMIPSNIAQSCIRSDVDEFDLYCFINSKEVQVNPTIKDPDIEIFNK